MLPRYLVFLCLAGMLLGCAGRTLKQGPPQGQGTMGGSGPGGMPGGPGSPGGGEPGGMPGGPGGGMPGGGGGKPGKACPTKAPFGSATTVKKGANSYTVFITSCPAYDWSAQSTGNTATYQNQTWTFRSTPVLSTKPLYVGITGANGATNASPVMGAIGITVTGIHIFSDADALKRDAYVYEGKTFDACGGHASPGGSYHFHTDQLKSGCIYTRKAGKHSPLLGVMADSIPIYGPLGDGGKAPSDLDECGGHTDSTHPYYHYHAKSGLKSPYTVACLRGCIFNAQSNPQLSSHVVTAATCHKASKQYDYSDFKPKWK